MKLRRIATEGNDETHPGKCYDVPFCTLCHPETVGGSKDNNLQPYSTLPAGRQAL